MSLTLFSRCWVTKKLLLSAAPEARHVTAGALRLALRTKAGANSCRAGRPGSPTRMQVAGPPARPAVPSAPRRATGTGKWQKPTWERGDAEVLGAPGSRSMQSPALAKTHAARGLPRAVPGTQPPQHAAGYLLRSPTPHPLPLPPHPPPSPGRRRNLRWSSDRPWRSRVSAQRCHLRCLHPGRVSGPEQGCERECERVKVRLWVHEGVWQRVRVGAHVNRCERARWKAMQVWLRVCECEWEWERTCVWSRALGRPALRARPKSGRSAREAAAPAARRRIINPAGACPALEDPPPWLCGPRARGRSSGKSPGATMQNPRPPPTRSGRPGCGPRLRSEPGESPRVCPLDCGCRA